MALDIVKQRQQEANRLQVQLLSGIMGMADGFSQQSMMIRAAIDRMHRGMAQSPMPSGLQR
jgi:hypothetical protein